MRAIPHITARDATTADRRLNEKALGLENGVGVGSGHRGSVT
jgi:hypothetical protein